MLGELFTPIETPEAQNRGFLKGFFGGNANTFDREELCVFPILLFHVYYWVLYKSVVENVTFSCICHFLKTLSAVGEAAAGKASRSLAQHIPGQAGVEGMKVAASGAVGELARARIALDERGQRLGELEERTALMMASAETFSKHAHEVLGEKRPLDFNFNLDFMLKPCERYLCHADHIKIPSLY